MVELFDDNVKAKTDWFPQVVCSMDYFYGVILLCKLAEIVSPGEYLVLRENKKHVYEVRKIEKCLTEDATQEYSVGIFKYSPFMKVAVNFEPGTQVKRGVIDCEIVENRYRVFLVDYGYHIEAEKSNIRLIFSKKCTEVEPLCFKLKLDGVLPTKAVLINGEVKKQFCKKWSNDAEDFVKKLFANNQKLAAGKVRACDGTVYGDLFLKFIGSSKYVSLRNLLLNQSFCAYAGTLFMKLECLNSPLRYLEPKVETNDVEKWIKEHFEVDQEESLSFDSSSDISSEEYPSQEVCKGARKPLFCDVTPEKKLSINSQDEKVSGESTVFAGEKATFRKGEGRGKLLSRYLTGRKKEKAGREETEGRSVIAPEKNPKTFDTNDSPLFDDASSSERQGPNSLSTSATEVGCGRGKRLEKILSAHKAGKAGPSAEPKVGTDGENSNLPEVNSRLEDAQKAAKLPRSQSEKISQYWSPLVIFEDSGVEPVNAFKELPVTANVILNLEKGGRFNELSPLQRWAIPFIRKQCDVVVIGSSKTGKTLSYVISIVDYIQDGSYFEGLPEGNGPCVVVVCSSSRVCESVYYLCHSLLGNECEVQRRMSKVKIVLAHGGGPEERIRVKLTNGCDVLISTAPCLARLLEAHAITNFERLTCLVFDEVDVISQDPFRRSVRVILEKAKRCGRSHHHQKIFIGEKWTDDVESLVKSYLESPALVIGSCAEAAIYQRIQPRLYLVNRNGKAASLLDILREMEAADCLIICESPAEAVSARDFFAGRNVDSLVAHDQMSADELKEASNAWEASSPRPLLIATDGVLSELRVKSVRTLVHLDLPSKSKTNFFLRYSAFNNSHQSQEGGKATCLRNVLLVDDENHYQLPHIVDFIVRLGGKIPPKILAKCEEIRRGIEERKVGPICRNLLSFGDCPNSKACSWRHAFVPKLDSPGNLPSRGWLNFLVANVRDASCFSARLIGHVDVDGRTSKLDADGTRIFVDLSNFFGVEANRRPHGVAAVGDICAVRVEVLGREIFHRAEVIEFVAVDKYEQPLIVNVRLMDQGDILKVENRELYEIPGELAERGSLMVDARLVGVQALDFDVAWSEEATGFAENLLTRNLEDNEYWTGRVALALRDTVFLESVMLRRILPNVSAHTCEFVVQEELLKHKIATANPRHVLRLRELCGGSTSSVSCDFESEKKKQMKAEWAFFETNFMRVRFLSAENTSTVFLQPKKFQSLLEDLEAVCEEEGSHTKKEMERMKSKGLTSPKLAVGMFVLARFEDCWNRGRIEQENEDAFFVFFVDHGDFLFVSKADVIPISTALLLRLPCQAIECELVGLKHEKQCPAEVLRKIYEFSDDGALDLYVRVIEQKAVAEITGGRKYVLNVMTVTGKSLNKELAEDGALDVEEAERKHMEDMELRLNEGEEVEDGGYCSSTGSGKEAAEPWFGLLSDDLFEDEDGQEFLQEFAARLLSGVSPSKVVDPPAKVVSPDPNHVITQEKSVVVEKSAMAPDSREKRRRNSVGSLKTLENILTPKVIWCQNASEVQVKVMLEAVVDFRLDCSVRNFLFRCRVRDKQYAVDLRLFGAICPPLIRTTTNAFNVVITLKKLTNLPWPRLQADAGRQWWISSDVDVEGVEEKRDQLSEFIESAKRDMKEGSVREGTRDDVIYPLDEDSDSEDCKQSL